MLRTLRAQYPIAALRQDAVRVTAFCSLVKLRLIKLLSVTCDARLQLRVIYVAIVRAILCFDKLCGNWRLQQPSAGHSFGEYCGRKAMPQDEVSPHILIVEDARDIRDPLARYMREHGYRATTAADAASARKIMKGAAIDLVVLDIMMPGEDGLSLCRSIHETSQIPVILLTARGEEVDRIVGLEMGADDYIAKPFSPRELIARIAAVLRRTQALPPRQRPPVNARVRFGDWTLDTGQREVIGPDGVALPLSSGEFRLLSALIERPKISLSRNQLLDLTKGRDADLFDRSIDNHVSRLRKKIEPDPKNPRYIKTVWGGGYVFAVDPVSE
jgi:two-component system, OmpR family, response regulator